MKTVYEPIFGSQERWDLTIVRPSLECNKNEEAEALANGWLMFNGRWYLTRSVRVATRKIAIPHEFIVVKSNDVDPFEISEIWTEYLDRKGFTVRYDLFCDKTRSNWLMLRNREGKKLVSFTKMLQYTGGLESQFNAYVKHNLSIGKIMLDAEINYAHDRCEYLYIGPGVENGSVYKASIPGFEWWTGSSWSTDQDAYVAACKRDSDITSLAQLDQLWKTSPVS